LRSDHSLDASHRGADLPDVILIAERDQHVRGLQRHFLDRAGFEVEFADDGLAALELAQASKPALVVTEILIPKIDGLTLCRRIRENPVTRSIPVVVFSILAAEARAIEAGATDFLRKPLIESVFLAVVQNAIGAGQHGALESK
jgi:CheY-like chemotaxis protein